MKLLQPAICSAVIASCGLAVADPLSLTEIGGFELNPALVVPQGADRPSPVWSGGALITIDSNAPDRSLIEIKGPDGSLLSSISFAIPKASCTKVRRAARGQDGSLALIGYWEDFAGRSTPFLALLDSGGGTRSIVDVDPLMPAAVAVADDGTVWVQGAFSTRATRPDPDPAHGVIRHFDKSGKLLGSLIPSAAARTLQYYSSFLSATSNKLGWLSWTYYCAGSTIRCADPPGKYVELTLDGSDSVSEYPLPGSGEMSVHGFGLLPDGTAIAQVQTYSKAHVAENNTLYTLDRDRRAWTAIDIPGYKSLLPVNMLGVYGNKLAVGHASGPGEAVRSPMSQTRMT